MLKLYVYAKCSTCRDAMTWLRERGIAFKEIAIRETPPPVSELKAMLAARGGKLTAICNTSGMDYRALGMKEKLPALSIDAALTLLTTNGNLIKRPFALDAARGVFLVGFKEADWEKALR